MQALREVERVSALHPNGDGKRKLNLGKGFRQLAFRPVKLGETIPGPRRVVFLQQFDRMEILNLGLRVTPLRAVERSQVAVSGGLAPVGRPELERAQIQRLRLAIVACVVVLSSEVVHIGRLLYVAGGQECCKEE